MQQNTSKLGTLLVVDDNPTNLEVLSTLLDEAGYDVRIATDGSIALDRVRFTHPDLILLDVMMPGMDGFETCSRLKSNPNTDDIPIIFMTALTDVVDKVKGFSLGAVDYITKPFQREEVLARIQVHLQINQLSKTLATQNNLLRQEVAERIAAEENARRLTQELQQLTQTLEQRVQERTLELSQALQNLKQVQNQLIQNEKLSALGQLVAGVAHEINNPIGCVVGNLSHLENYSQDLVNIIRLYRQHFPDPPPALQQALEDVDWEYLQADLPKLLRATQVGIDRIRELSRSLRTFARADTNAKVAANLHEGLEINLLILQHRLKGNSKRPAIKINRAYQPNLPLVCCYPGPVNQVFMNILSNSIDALDDGDFSLANSVPTINIHTSVTAEQQQVIIRIHDNGPGIPPEIQPQLFEPMFTTKAVGKGTGLGLSISRQIVCEQHGGDLSFVSTPDSGTEFIITLPIND